MQGNSQGKEQKKKGRSRAPHIPTALRSKTRKVETKSNDDPYVPHVYVKKSEQQSINQCLISTGLRNYVPVE